MINKKGKGSNYVFDRMLQKSAIEGGIEGYAENHAKLFCLYLMDKGVIKGKPNLDKHFKNFMDGV